MIDNNAAIALAGVTTLADTNELAGILAATEHIDPAAAQTISVARHFDWEIITHDRKRWQPVEQVLPWPIELVELTNDEPRLQDGTASTHARNEGDHSRDQVGRVPAGHRLQACAQLPGGSCTGRLRSRYRRAVPSHSWPRIAERDRECGTARTIPRRSDRERLPWWWPGSAHWSLWWVCGPHDLGGRSCLATRRPRPPPVHRERPIDQPVRSRGAQRAPSPIPTRPRATRRQPPAAATGRHS